MTAAAALVVTGLYLAPREQMPVSTVEARESFGGIKQVVEEHDEDNPFVILDIVPGKAYADVMVRNMISRWAPSVILRRGSPRSSRISHASSRGMTRRASISILTERH